MERQILQHLRTDVKDKKPSPDNIMDGELAINYAANGETLYIKNSDEEITEFKDNKYYQKQLSEISARVFIGTQEEYDIAYAEGKVAVGALVIILDENETNSDATTAMLGKAIIGTLLLGRA